MRKLKLFLTLLMLMCIGVTQMWGTDITFGWSQWNGVTGNFSGTTKDEVTQTVDGVVVTYTRNGSSLYANSTAIRFYGSNTLKFEAPTNSTISSIVIAGSSFKDDVTTDVATCTSTTSALSWEGDASSVTFTRTGTSYITMTGATVTLKVSTPADPYTVSFSTGTGNGSVAALTEDPAGAGITLPAGPTSIACEGWSFAGWAEATVASETTTAPTLLAVGANYKPVEDCTLYAVYSRTESGSGGGVEDKSKTEGFETKATSTTYNGTVTINTNESDCGIGWSIYYGTVSTNDKIAGSNSAQMRWYSSAKTNIPYAKTTTAISGLQSVNFKARVSSTDVKVSLWYSTDGENWTISDVNQETFAAASTAYDFSATINGEVGTGYYVKIGEDGGTAPSSSSVKLIIDAVTFNYQEGSGSSSTTYYLSTPTCSTPTCEKLGTPTVTVPAANLTYNSAKLTWAAVANANKYLVKFNGTEQEATSNLYFDASDLDAETQYTYQVKALAAANQDDYCDGDFSASASFTTLAAPTCEKKVTISKGTPEIGSFSLNKEEGAYETCDAAFEVIVTPAEVEHYHVSEVTASNSTSISDPDADGKYTITYAKETNAESVINVTYVEDTKYDVTWSVNGVESTNKAYYGAHPTLPAAPTSSCDETSTTFMGWAAEAWSGKLAAPATTVYTSAEAMPVVEAEGVKYFAVFAKAGEATSVTHTLTIADKTADSNYGSHSEIDDKGATWSGVYNFGDATHIGLNKKSDNHYLGSPLFAANVNSVKATIKNGSSSARSAYLRSDNETAQPSSGDLGSVSVPASGEQELTFTLGETAFKQFYVYVSDPLQFHEFVVTLEGAPSYSDYMTTCCTKYNVNIANGIEHGSVTADLAKACEGATVTLTITPATNYHLKTLSVMNGETPVEVTENTFTMPAGNVTISATFEEDACDPLATPVVTVSGKAYPYNAVKLAWSAITNADSYKVYIYDAEDNELEHNDAVTGVEYTIGQALSASTTYKYSVQAISNTPAVHCPSVAATGTFATDALPTAHLTLMVNGSEATTLSGDHTILTPFDLPTPDAVAGCPKVFVGWDADENCATEPTYAAGAEFTFANTTGVTLYAVYAKAGAGAAVSYPIDFEDNSDTFTDWTLTNITSKKTDSNVSAHEGNYFAETAGTTSASLVTKEKIASPSSITFYVSKKTTNTSASSWVVEVSADGSAWDQVGDAQDAKSMSRGDWVEVTRNLSEYSDVYVRVYYEGGTSTAVRCIDDLELSAIGSTTYSEYSTACEACKTVTLAKAGEDQEKGNTFALKVGDDDVKSVQTCEAASVNIVASPATGYEASFAISELEGASLSENIISLAANTNGELTVTATFMQKNHTVTLAQNPAAGATLVGGKEDAHYNETINLSTDVPTGYEFINWTSESVEITNATNATGASFTMPDADVTVTANFGKVYTVSFNAGSDPITETAIGAGVELPAGPALSQACQDDGWDFAGWAEAAVAEQTTTAPELNAAGATYYPTTDIELFAVYKKDVAATTPKTKYVKTALTDIADGSEVVITELYSNTIYAAANDGGTSTGPAAVELAESATDVLNVGDNTNIFWVLTKDGANFSLTVKGGTDKLYCTDTNNGVRVGTNENNVFSISSDYIFNNATSRYVGYNHGNGGLFRCYTSINTNINNETLVFYKATSVVPTTTYYLSAPVCCTKYDITIADGIEHGSVVADLAEACEGEKVTLTPTAADNYHFEAWAVSYNDGENDHEVNVNEEVVEEVKVYSFTMPAYAVTVDATFVHDDCTPLTTPANVEVVADYKSAMLDWDDVTDANHYIVTIKNGEETVESNTVDASEYEVVATLLASTTYTYEIQATADDAASHCPSALATENFNTEALPNYTLTLMENGVERAEDAEYTKTHAHGVEFNLPASSTSACTGKVFVGWSNKQGDLETTDLISNPVSLTQNTTFYAVYATEGAGVVTPIFSETFDACNGTGANDDNGWSGSIASSTLPNALSKSWTFVKGNAAYQCAKFGTGSVKGSAQTPTIELTGAATLTFRAGAWNGGSEGTTLNVSATGATLNKSSVTMVKGAWTSYTVAISEATGTVTIKFEAQNASNNRFFLDDVVVSQSAIVYTDYTTSCAAALAEPTFSPIASEYDEAKTITISGPEDATIYYTTDGSEPTTESAVYGEAITINKCGETTIKAFAKNGDSESAVAEATYTLNLPMPENSQAAPYTPTQAIAVYDGNGYCYDGTTVMFVKGVVKSCTEFNSNFGNYDVVVRNIGDETPEAPTFTYYHMYAASGKVKFTADEEIAAGDTIIAAGVLTLYGTTYEFANNTCYMVEHKKYQEPKQHIANTQDNPYTIAQAIGFCDNAIQYDLTDEVYVRGVVTSINSSKTIIAHDPDVENSFQFYKANLNENEVGDNDTIIAKGTILKYNANTYEMNEGGLVVEVKPYVAPIVPEFTVNPTAVAFGNVEQNASVDAIELNVELTAIENATVTLADENNVFSIDKTALTETGVVTVSVVSTATVGNYAATITLHDVAEAAENVVVNVTMNVTAVDPRHKAQDIDGFDATSGNLNSDIAFASVQGDGTAVPALQSNGSILYYQPASGKAAGGYMTLTAVHGCKIDQVKVVTATHATNIKYSKDGGELSEASDEIEAGEEYLTPALLDAETVNIYCAGADKTHRLYIAQVVVYYTGEAIPVHHKAIDITGMEASQFEFPKNGTFTHAGLKVYACYDENCDEKVEITADCHVEADLTTTGEKKAKVYYGEELVDEYDINVIAGQENPALAYTPTSETIAAANVASWSAPAFSNPLNVSPISFSSNNTAVATVDENGVIALAGGYGTAKITASFEETEDYIASEATYTITIQEPINKIDGDWRLVTSTADITVGSKVIIVGTKNNTKYAMGEQKPNNRAAVAVVSEDATSGVIEPAEGTKTFTLVDAGDGMYAFKANNGKYLYAAGSTYLREQAMINGNASWTITITSGGTTIEANGTNSNKSMRMNPNGSNAPLFSSYASGQNAVTLYVNRTVIPGSNDPEHPADPVIINTNVEEEEIVANGNVIVTVNTDNFEEPKSYIAQNGATIIINGNGSEEAKSVVADEQSTIRVNQPTTVNQVFSVAATMGAGLSGQITGVDNVTIAESTEAYFDITLGDNANSNKWHAIAVPFPVDAISGIYDAETGAKLNNEEHYAIMDYHGDIRAQGLYGWKKFRGIMSPGVFYLMTVDGNTKTFRFKMSGTTLPTATSLALQLYAASGAGQSTDAGWNGVANPTLKHGTVNQTVTVLNPNTYTYEDKDAGEMNFVVGTPYFIQANATIVEQGMEMGAVDDTKPYYAPKRVSENGFENIKVFFGNDEYKDKLTISANVEALNEYQIGKDLVKMTMTNTPSVAQIFGNAYNAKLCRVYAPMANDQAEYSLTLYAPNAGEYTISAPEIEDADIFLTYEGSIIWNLSMSDYTNDFAKGNNEGYGLILVKKAPQVITGVDNAEANEAGVQKVIINDHVYILRAEQMYDVTGKMVK